MNTDLQTAIEMIRLGDTPGAYKLVANHVRKYPKDSHAWYLLSFTVDKKEQKIDCLERALKLSPDYLQAKKRLLQLTQTNTYDKNTPTKISVDEETTSTENHAIEITTQGHNLIGEIPSITLLDPVIENWCSNLSYREQKVIEYLYLGADYFSVGAVGRIISESPAKVLDIRKRAFDKLHQNYIGPSIDPLMSSVITAIKNNGDLNESDLVGVLQDTWSARKHNLIGLVRLIRSIEDTHNEFSKNKINEPQSNNNLGQGKSIPKSRLKKPIDKEQSPLPTKGPVPDVSDPKNLSDKNAPKPPQITSSFADEKIVEETIPIGVPKEENTLTNIGSTGSNSQKNEPDIESATSLVLDKEKEKIPSSSKNRTPSLKHEYRLWQIGGKNEKREKRPDVLQFLIDDITRLPIITNPHQEQWLGIQLQAAKRLKSILSSKEHQTISTAYPQIICSTLLSNWLYLEQKCLDQELHPPKLEVWVSELLLARRNVYSLNRSRLRRFLRKIQEIKNDKAVDEFLGVIYQVVETLAILSTDTLTQLITFINTNECLPSVDEMKEWLPTEEKMLEQQTQIRVKQAQQLLATGYLRYAMRVAQGFVGKGVPYADLVQAGFMGLLRAAKRFDYRVQARFGTYAISWIWQGVSREISDQGQTIRIPVHMQESLRKWEIACRQYDNGHHDPSVNVDILFHSGLLEQSDHDEIQEMWQRNSSPSTKAINNYEKAVLKARKLSTISQEVFPLTEIHIIDEVNELVNKIESIEEIVPDGSPYLENTIDLPFVRQAINDKVFSFLTEREREVLELRYGWTDGQGRTLEEVGRHFGLTRERIRQIEAKIIKKFERIQKHGELLNIYDLFPEDDPYPPKQTKIQIILPSTGLVDEGDTSKSDQLGILLGSLPHSHWHERQSNFQEDTRRDQLVAALQILKAPSHVADITEQLNGMTEGKDLEDAYVYNLLTQAEETFILLGQGIFSLVQWEKEKIKQPLPILACCPMPLPDPPDFEDAFFESVLVGQQLLSKKITAAQFINHMLQWTKNETNPQKWFVQTILSAYYLVDIIPYVFAYGGEDPVLQCTLPNIPIQELRYHCLETLTQRLAAMPEFWWLLQQYQPVRPTDLGEQFADIHPYGLDDTLQRLRLLASLGAAQKLKYGEYKLTPIGEECANRWKREAIMDTPTSTGIDELDLDTGFGNFVAW